jgi:MFS transporter, YNFM family, putative membrane transport protein
LIFVAYLAGSLASPFAGRLADRFGRPHVLCVTAVITLAGLALLATGSVAAVIVGLIITTGGFFAAHAVASGWVSARSATLGVQGPAVYVFCYYLGSSLGGTVGGLVYSAAGWPGVTDYAGAFLVAVLILAILLRRLRPAAPMAATP